jgi:hypothetical protein
LVPSEDPANGIQDLGQQAVPVAPTANGAGLIVLGFDEQQKPCGARFDDGKPELVAKAADLMGFKVYRTASPDLPAVCTENLDSDIMVM